MVALQGFPQSMRIGVRGYNADFGIHPVVVYHIKIDTRTAVNHNKVLLFLSIFATCFGR